MINELVEKIMTRTSIRQFTNDSIPDDDLTTLVKAGMSAPSAVNVQPWEFVIVTDRTKLDKLCAELPYAKMLDKANAAIVVCGNPQKDIIYAKDYWIQDCSAATQNILLAAHAMGYGSVWTAVFPEEDRVKIVREVLGIPLNIIPLNVLPIGVPINKNTIPKDKFKPEYIHRNMW